MGRSSSGKYTTGESNRLDLRVMLRNRQIQKNRFIRSSIEWTNGSKISFESKYTDEEVYFRVMYTITDYHTKEVYKYDYKIQLTTIPSNLGKGEILYFVCPESGKRAKVLFMAYGHHKYIHRDWYLERYGVRLYYNSQIAEKNYYHLCRYHKLDREIEILENRLFAKYRKLYYKGEPTKDHKKLIALKDKSYYHESKSLMRIQKFIDKRYGE